jgi:VanZ family protein
LRYKLAWVLMGVLWIATIIYLSLTSISLPALNFGFGIDKIEHAIAYFVLMAWFGQIYNRPLQLACFAFVFVNLGIGLEYLQALGGHRMFEYADMVANAVGVLLGLWLTVGWLNGLLRRFEDWIAMSGVCSK